MAQAVEPGEVSRNGAGRVARDGAVPGTLLVEPVASAAAWALLRLRGELDLATRASLAAVLAELLDGGCRDVRIEMTGLTFCDTAGLSALDAAYRAFLAAGGTLALTGVAGPARRLLELTGLDRTLLAPAETRSP